MVVLFLYRTCIHCLLAIMEMHICRKNSYWNYIKEQWKGILIHFIVRIYLWAMASECPTKIVFVFQISLYLHWPLVDFAVLQKKTDIASA